MTNITINKKLELKLEKVLKISSTILYIQQQLLFPKNCELFFLNFLFDCQTHKTCCLRSQ